MKSYFLHIIALFACLTLHAEENESENDSSADTSESQESSVIDDVIDAITEAAISNPDYGKDIGDR